jgi:hypothetical protein
MPNSGAKRLNLNSTNYPDRDHHGDPPLSGKIFHGRAENRTRDLMISSQKRWPLDHDAGQLALAALEVICQLFPRHWPNVRRLVARVTCLPDFRSPAKSSRILTPLWYPNCPLSSSIRHEGKKPLEFSDRKLLLSMVDVPWKRLYEHCQTWRSAPGDAMSWGSVLQTTMTQVRFPMVSLKFFIDIIFPVALWP